ncbi:unnamed protein product, partial [marine sediment metagenome]
SGSKSEKLSSAWEHFDGDDDGELNRNELCMYLRSFLCALTCFSIEGFQGMESNFENIRQCIKIGAYEATEKVFSQTECGRTISFHKFGKWYTEGGFHLCPWLELLDVHKWNPSATNTDAMTKLDEEEEIEDEVAEVEDDVEDDADDYEKGSSSNTHNLSDNDVDNSGDPIEFLFVNDVQSISEAEESQNSLVLRKSSVDAFEKLLMFSELHTENCIDISISVLSMVALDFSFTFSDDFLKNDEEGQLMHLL